MPQPNKSRRQALQSGIGSLGAPGVHSRRSFQRNSNGNDPGIGNILLVPGKKVNGGIIYGECPGLYAGTADDWLDYPNPQNGCIEG
jgi:hypothetical protein